MRKGGYMKRVYRECPSCGSAAIVDNGRGAKNRFVCSRCKQPWNSKRESRYKVTAAPSVRPLSENQMTGYWADPTLLTEVEPEKAKFGHHELDKAYKAYRAGNTRAKWKG